MDMRIEAITLGVTDVDRAKAFYEQLGFTCDVDHQMSEEFRVVQFTPPGSNASIIFGVGIGGGEPGAVQGLYLCVDDIEATLADLKSQGSRCHRRLSHRSRGADGGAPSGAGDVLDHGHHDRPRWERLADPGSQSPNLT